MGEIIPSWELTIGDICKQWSVPYLFPHQQLCVHYILSACGYFGDDSEQKQGLIVSLPTGSGKSLCFMAPAGIIDGISIVFYPLNALLRDQRRRFESAGVETILYYGGMEREEKKSALERIRKLERGVIISNVESASSEVFLASIQHMRITLMVIDEGHLILQWGRSFRPTLLKIDELRKAMGNPICAVFTATINEADRLDLGKMLWPDGDWDYFELLSDRINISYRLIPCIHEVTALRLLIRQALDPSFDLLASHPEIKQEISCPMLVFVPKRDACEQLARQAAIWLSLWGRSEIRTWYYHAGMTSDERKKIEHDFAQSNNAILFTTKAFGTGVDISGIRSTIHFCEPETMEDFLQESGRAGRDGAPAFSYTLQKTPRLFIKDGCRRRQALEALGQEPAICSGCDYCEGISWNRFLESEAILQLRRINRIILAPEDEYRFLRYEDFADMKAPDYVMCSNLV